MVRGTALETVLQPLVSLRKSCSFPMLLERSKRRPVLWRRGGKTGGSLAGKGVFLRVFYRDATIFAVGHGADADTPWMQ